MRWTKYNHYLLCENCKVETDRGYKKNGHTLCVACYKKLTKWRNKNGRKKDITPV